LRILTILKPGKFKEGKEREEKVKLATPHSTLRQKWKEG